MTTEAVKSVSITNLDANPPLRGTSGKDGFGRRMEMVDYALPLTGVTTGSTYRLGRIPTNARNVRITLETHGTITTLTGDVGLYYPSQTADEVGKSQGIGTGAVDADFFASALAMSTVDVPTSATNESGTYDTSKRGKEIWDAAGVDTTDPGGFYDVVFTTTATSNLTNGALLGAEISYVPGYLS